MQNKWIVERAIFPQFNIADESRKMFSFANEGCKLLSLRQLAAGSECFADVVRLDEGDKYSATAPQEDVTHSRIYFHPRL